MRVDVGTWEEVFKRDKGFCQYCGIDLLSSFSAFHSATVDHVIAVAAGRSDDASNLVLSCPSCNSILSRSSSLKTFEQRKQLVLKRIEERQGWYQPLVAEFRTRA